MRLAVLHQTSSLGLAFFMLRYSWMACSCRGGVLRRKYFWVRVASQRSIWLGQEADVGVEPGMVRQPCLDALGLVRVAIVHH